MVKEIICPCCNNKIKLLIKDGDFLPVFFDVQNQEEIKQVLIDKHIEFGEKGGD